MPGDVVDLLAEGHPPPQMPRVSPSMLLPLAPLFIEPTTGMPFQRILAESQLYLALSTPSPASKTAPPSQPVAPGVDHQLLLMEKSQLLHTVHRCNAPIRAVSFVNYLSNTGACATDFELQVWTVKVTRSAHNASPQAATQLVCEVILRLNLNPGPNPMVNLAFFIDSTNNAPNLFILRRNDAAIVPSANHIKDYVDTCAHLDANQDVRVMRVFNPAAEGNSNSKSSGAPPGSACAISDNGIFAFQVDATHVLACTGANAATPKWACCHRAPVMGLVFLSHHPGGEPHADVPATLLASCSSGIFEWGLSGTSDPLLMRQLVFGAAPLVAMVGMGNSIAVFNATQQLTVVDNLRLPDGAPGPLSVTVYQLPEPVPELPRLTFTRTKQQCTLYLVDDVSLRSLQWSTTSEGGPHLSNFFSKGVVSGITSTTAAGTTTTSKVSLPSVAEMMLTTKRRDDVAVEPLPTTSGGTASAAGFYAPKTFHNLSLPQQADMGELPAVAAQSREALNKALEPIRIKLQNIIEIQDVTSKQLEEGSKKLLSLSLEAEMAVLQEHCRSVLRQGSVSPPQRAAAPGSMAAALGAPTGPAPSPAATARLANEKAFNGYLQSSLMESMSHIVYGIADATTVTMNNNLPRIVESTMKTSLRDAQRACIQKRLNQLLSESTAGISDRLEKSFAELRAEVGKEADRSRDAFAALKRENQELREIIKRLTSRSALSRMEGLQREVQQLRAAVQQLQEQGLPGAGMAAPAGPSVLDTALVRFRDEREAGSALSHLVRGGDPLLMLEFLEQLEATEVDQLVGGEFKSQIPAELWAAVVRDLAKAAAQLLLLLERSDAAEGLERVVRAAHWVQDILSEEDALTSHPPPTNSLPYSLTTALREMRASIKELLDVGKERGSDSPSLVGVMRSLRVHIREARGGV